MHLHAPDHVPYTINTLGLKSCNCPRYMAVPVLYTCRCVQQNIKHIRALRGFKFEILAIASSVQKMKSLAVGIVGKYFRVGICSHLIYFTLSSSVHLLHPGTATATSREKAWGCWNK